MAKRKGAKFADEQRRKKRAEQDAQLSVGLSNYANDLDDGLLVDDGLHEQPTKDWDNEEQDYELKPRSLKQDVQDFNALPIKRAGKVERVAKTVESEPEESEQEQDEENEDGANHEEDEGEIQSEGEEEDDDEEEFTEQKIITLKEDIADLVEKLIEEPEENIGALARLLKMAKSKNPNTSQLSLLAIVPALKSIVPGYRIRPLTQLEQKEKVSRDIQKLRNFEQTLVLNYKSYVDLLTELTKNAIKTPILGQLAAKAACELATAFRHFNFVPDVLLIIIRRICRPAYKNDPVFHTCVKTLENLIDEDDTGDISFDITRLLTKTIRSRKFRVDESVVNIFLSLNILTDYDPNATEEEKAERQKIKKKDRPHLSKKERKQKKERKEIEEELRKAEQKVSEEEREKFQSQILKLILKFYLDILKEKIHSLLAAVLEGLAKIGHMANFDLLGDFLEVFREIIKGVENEEDSESLSRQVLLSIATSFALVATHSQYKVQVDLTSFVDSLYKILFQVGLDVDIEFSHKTLRLADPLNNTLVKPSVNISTKIELLLRGLENIFFRSKNGSKLRALAFAKRLSMILLQTPEKSSIALLKFLEKLLARYSDIAGLFTTEDRISNGKFLMAIDNPQRSNADAATVYELFLLEKHYSPIVSKGAKSLLAHSKEVLK